jgi:hypothetical protein
LQSPKETKTWASGKINCNSNAGQMKSSIQGFFTNSKRTGSNISVSLVMTDSAGVITTNSALSKKNVYTVKLMKRIKGFSFTSATVLPYGSISSTVTIQGVSAPTSIASSPPLFGSFILICTDQAGVSYKTAPQPLNQWDRGLQLAIDESIPFLRGRVKVF